MENDTHVFDLRVKCDRRRDAAPGETDPKKLYYDSNVYTGMMKWVPSGQQKSKYKGKEPRPVLDDILLVKLRPGQMVDLHCFARKGVGADHAKYSPVATASYRLLPHIILREPIPLEDQEKFKSCFAPGVIELEKDADGNQQVVVKNPRKDTVSREVLRHKEFQDKVELARIRDHFICEYLYQLTDRICGLTYQSTSSPLVSTLPRSSCPRRSRSCSPRSPPSRPVSTSSSPLQNRLYTHLLHHSHSVLTFSCSISRITSYRGLGVQGYGLQPQWGIGY